MAKKILRIIEKYDNLKQCGCICTVIREAHYRHLFGISYEERNKILDWVIRNNPGHYDSGIWFPMYDWASRIEYLKSF